jgi:hypothetical protein
VYKYGIHEEHRVARVHTATRETHLLVEGVSLPGLGVLEIDVAANCIPKVDLPLNAVAPAAACPLQLSYNFSVIFFLLPVSFALSSLVA